MLEFTVSDMSCSHCTGTIGKAIKELDPSAVVDFDLSQHLCRVDSAISAAAMEAAIRAAGYSPHLKSPA